METTGMNIAAFHMLPSGGGARLAAQNISLLQHRFSWFIHSVEGSVEFPNLPQVAFRRHGFPRGRRLSGVSRFFAPWLLVRRLQSFAGLCARIALQMNRDGQVALVHNSMIIAAPPVLDHLSIPSVYFCYEYPRHLYEKPRITRTGSILGDQLLLSLEMRERRSDRESVAADGKVATFSPYMRNRLKEIYGVEAEMVYPGVDSSFFTPGDPGVRGSHLLSVGALWPFKGHDSAIRAVSMLPESVRPPLVIAADREFPGYGGRLQRYAIRNRVDLRIERAISDESLLGLYRSSLAVLCFQYDEPYGLVPLEAMACGKPVIARDSGGFADNIRNRETGLLFQHSVPEARDLILEAITDQGLSQRIADAGRDFAVGSRSPSSCADRLADLISSCRLPGCAKPEN